MATYMLIALYIHLNSYNRDSNLCKMLSSLAITYPTYPNFESCRSFEKTVSFSQSFEIRNDFDYKASKSSSTHVVRALKYHLKEEKLTHGQETAPTSKFSALIFETYFSWTAVSWRTKLLY